MVKIFPGDIVTVHGSRYLVAQNTGYGGKLFNLNNGNRLFDGEFNFSGTPRYIELKDLEVYVGATITRLTFSKEAVNRTITITEPTCCKNEIKTIEIEKAISLAMHKTHEGESAYSIINKVAKSVEQLIKESGNGRCN